MSDRQPCVRTILARSESFVVEKCSCGLVHIYAGPVTLHMEPEECEGFTTVMACAMVNMAKMKEKQNPALRLVPSDPERGAVGEASG